jgi:inorganic triphosphatase YgiF
MEFELKFQIPADRWAAVEAELRHGGPVTRTRLQARYFDTADGRLAARGIVLRLRKEGSRWVQTAKAAGHGLLARHEHEVDLGFADARRPPAPDPRRHDGTPLAALLAAALDAPDAGARKGSGKKAGKTSGGDADPVPDDAADARPGGPALVQTYATDIWRLTRLDTLADGGRAELALDQGSVRAGSGTAQRSAPIRELEIELKAGPAAPLVAAAAGWAQRHGLWLSTVTKSAHGERLVRALRGDDAPAPAVHARPPAFGHRPTGRRILQAAVEACLAQVLPNASEVAAGSTDADQIHQLRVGLRRLRTALRELGRLHTGPAPLDAAGDAALARAFRALGAHRDQDHLQAGVQPDLVAAGGPPVDLAVAEAAATPPGDATRAPDLQAALLALIGFVVARPGEGQDPGEGGGSGPGAAGPGQPEAGAAQAGAAEPDGATGAEPAHDLSHGAARRRLRKRLRRLRADVVHDAERFATLDTEAQHALRKRLKRLRYLSEFVAPLFDPQRADAFLRRLKPALDALGRQQDAATALAGYRRAAATDPRAWFGVGWLCGRQPQRLQDCTHALHAVSKAPAFWKRGH